MIQSNTKALTSLLLASLVDDGKLRWDQPVVEVWPEFKVGDPATTASIQVQHLMCACTGLPRQDAEALFEYGDATPASMMKLLATIRPTTKFGETFHTPICSSRLPGTPPPTSSTRQSAVASRKNDDGTISFVTMAPEIGFLPLVVGAGGDGTRQLILRFQGQQEYVFVEAK